MQIYECEDQFWCKSSTNINYPQYDIVPYQNPEKENKVALKV